MKVLIAKEPGVAEYIELPKPVPEDDQVVIKIECNGICATDLEILSGIATFMHDGSTSYPVRIGHEYSGIIVEMGKNVTGYEIGERVVGNGVITCGKCDACRSGNPRACSNVMDVGTINTWPGSYAEYMLLPAKDLFKIPENLTPEQVALIEPASIGMYGINKANIVPGESVVLITGVGAIGIACAAFAKWKGAKQVIISGRTPYKLDIAKKMGADLCHNPKVEPLADFIERETDGHGCDCVIECSGNSTVLKDCVDVLAQYGTMVIVGLYGKCFSDFDIDKFLFKEGNLQTVADHATFDTIRAMGDGVDLTPLITRHIKFDEAKDVLTELINSQSKENIKIMVDFD